MFIFKKFQKQNDSNNGNNVNAHNIRPMDQNLQKKFSRGIQYNSKQLIG